MKNPARFIIISLLASSLSIQAHSSELSLGKHNTIVVSNGKKKVGFAPDFCLIYRNENPKMKLKNLTECKYFVPVWEAVDVPPEKIFKERIYGAEHGGDGIDASLQDKVSHRLTGDYFYAGKRIDFTTTSVESRHDTIFIQAVATGYGDLSAKVYDDQKNYPVLEYDFRPSRDGYFSVVYTGAPEYSLDEVEEVWQPMVWQQKRFPLASYLTMAYQCSLPATMVGLSSYSYGVLADSKELPFLPLPTREHNNKFGVILRNTAGNAQPMIAAPILGGEQSQMKPGERFTMAIRLVVSPEKITDAYEDMAVNLFGFHDYRTNTISSTNQVIDRIIDYTLSPYSNFIDSLKGCSYSTDVPGSTKNVSSLHPLSIALVTDNDSLFHCRAFPIMEYMLSRDNTLFCLDTAQKVQRPSRKLGRPCSPTSELITLYELTGHNCDVLKEWAENKFYRNKPVEKREQGRGLWYDGLAMYKSGESPAYLDWAIRGADYYIQQQVNEKQSTFGGFFFWNSFIPKYIQLLEMYEATGKKSYLEAAHQAARYYAMFVWMCPQIPMEQITVNKGNKAPWYWYLKQRGIPQQSAPEETVDAWRLSEIGLTAESPTTGIGHRAVFMAHHAPYFLRLAHYTGDTFLRDIARSAIVGRYRNFPGYHINTERSTAYEQIDFPYHRHEEISSTSFHYNHPFPQVSFLIDYLVADAFDKSNEEIAFPSRHIEGYGYLQNKFYGHEPGHFYNEKNAWLWMPKGLVTVGHVELNYLSARADNALCIAFMNQCDSDVSTTFSIDTKRVPTLMGQKKAELWSADKKIGEIDLTDGKAPITVPAKGITSVIIKGCNIHTSVQENFAQKGSKWKNSSFHSDFGHLSALMLDMGKNLKEAYLFLRDDDSIFKEVTLLYRFDDGRFQMLKDLSYPFEFSVPVPEGTETIYMQIMGIDVNDNLQKGELFKLSKE